MREPITYPRTGNPATDYSIVLLGELVRLGLRHLVLSPGSRSQALALVAAELERVGAIELHVRIDERVGAFTALGIGLESGAPAAVVTTSGTATANLHPAVLEARAADVPLIVITADRPQELRGIRANQTSDQVELFGSATVWAADHDAPTGAREEMDAARRVADSLWSASLGLDEIGMRGPAHLNLAFRDPLSSAIPDLSALLPSSGIGISDEERPPFATTEGAARPVVNLAQGPRTVVVAGNGAGPAAEGLARAAGWPLIAEASSGSRFGPNLVVAYRELLADAEFGGAVERAVVFGHPTLSREVPALLARDGVQVLVVDAARPDFYSPGRRATAVAGVELDASLDPREPQTRAWTGSWVLTSRAIVEQQAAAAAGADQKAPDVEAARSRDRATQLGYAREELAAVREPVTRRMLADAVWRFTWPHDRLVLGASRLIRELDRTVGGKKITVHANRGLAGIDGTVATAIGVGLARPSAEPGITRVLLGDLTLLHDVGALLLAEGERMPALQVIVGNDGGGTIFDGLEVGRTAPADAMRRVMTTPREVDLAALAAAYGWRHLRAATRGELDQALSTPGPQPTLIEVPLA